MINNEEFAEVRAAVHRGDTTWLVAYLLGASVEDVRRVSGVIEPLVVRRAAVRLLGESMQELGGYERPSSSTDRAPVS